VAERDTQKAILQFLALKKLWAIRLNTGAAMYQTGGKTRFVRFGSPGLADIAVFTKGGVGVIWVEVKSKTGKLSEAQREFKKQAEEHGHFYIVARDVSDLYPLFGK